MIEFRAFRAVDNKELCYKYMEGHRKVLAEFGIQNITTNNSTWSENPEIYAIVAQSTDGREVYGGIRFQKVDGVHPLPVEDAVGKMDTRLYDRIKSFEKDGVGELCGLWNSRQVAGLGISMLLTRAGISIVNQLNVKTLLGICGLVTLPMFSKVGFEIDRTLGNNGDFFYPKPDLLAHVLDIMNAETLEKASPIDKERMLDIRSKPVQKCIELGPKGPVDVQYNLVI